MAIRKDACVLWLDKAMQGRVWNDVSGYGNDGVATGARFRESFWEFDGVDDKITIPPEDFPNVEGTIEILVKIREIVNGTRIYSSYDTRSSNYQFRTYSATQSSFNLFMGDGSDISLSVNIGTWTLNKWEHICFTWKPSGSDTVMKGYLNGKYISSDTEDGTPAKPNSSIALGHWHDEYANCEIALFRIYNVALTAQQIKELYEQSYRKI